MIPFEIDINKLKRLCIVSNKRGRIQDLYDIEVEGVIFQDKDETLKIFIKEKEKDLE